MRRAAPRPSCPAAGVRSGCGPASVRDEGGGSMRARILAERVHIRLGRAPRNLAARRPRCSALRRPRGRRRCRRVTVSGVPRSSTRTGSILPSSTCRGPIAARPSAIGDGKSRSIKSAPVFPMSPRIRLVLPQMCSRTFAPGVLQPADQPLLVGQDEVAIDLRPDQRSCGVAHADDVRSRLDLRAAEAQVPSRSRIRRGRARKLRRR